MRQGPGIPLEDAELLPKVQTTCPAPHEQHTLASKLPTGKGQKAEESHFHGLSFRRRHLYEHPFEKKSEEESKKMNSQELMKMHSQLRREG